MLTFIFVILILVLYLKKRNMLKILSRKLDRIELRLKQVSLQLEKIEAALKPVGAANVKFYVIIDGQKQEVKQMFKKVTDPLKFSVEVTDRFGNAAKVDGKPAWSLNDDSLGALSVSEDGMSADFASSGKVGSLKLQLKADADLGEGVKEILGESEAIDMIAGDAEVLKIKAE